MSNIDNEPASPYESQVDGTEAAHAVPAAGEATSTAEVTHGSHPRRGGGLVVGAIVAALLAGGVSGGLVSSSMQNDNGGGTTVSSTSTSASNSGFKTVNEKSNSTLTKVASSALPSVVTISVEGSSAAGTGSGIVLDDKGDIVTAAHVTTLEGATASGKISVQTSTGTVYQATLVGYDPTADVGVIRIPSTAKGTKPMTFANSNLVQVGDSAIAIGSPLGLANTVTTGIISTLSRPIEVASSQVGQSANSNSGGVSNTVSLNALQTDAAINSGNSGGALLNGNGHLIGMTDAIATASGSSGNIGIGFSIPSNYVLREAKEILTKGTGSHALLGAIVGDASETNSTFTAGARINSVTSGGAADKANLAANDVITSFDGIVVSNATQLTALVKEDAPGTTVKIGFTRDGVAHTVSVKLGG